MGKSLKYFAVLTTFILVFTNCNKKNKDTIRNTVGNVEVENFDVFYNLMSFIISFIQIVYSK